MVFAPCWLGVVAGCPGVAPPGSTGRPESGAEVCKPFQIALVRLRGRPRREKVLLGRGRERRTRPEQAPRLGRAKPRERRRFEKGGAAIGGLDEAKDFGRQFGREAEAEMDREEEASL